VQTLDGFWRDLDEHRSTGGMCVLEVGVGSTEVKRWTKAYKPPPISVLMVLSSAGQTTEVMSLYIYTLMTVNEHICFHCSLLRSLKDLTSHRLLAS
jgi:hypothetical protein